MSASGIRIAQGRCAGGPLPSNLVLSLTPAAVTGALRAKFKNLPVSAETGSQTKKVAQMVQTEASSGVDFDAEVGPTSWS